MQKIPTLLLRLVFLTAAIVFGASMAVAFAVMLAVWAVRAVWAKLTGQPSTPFVIRIDPRASFRRMYRHQEEPSRTPRADAVQPGRAIGDVDDVEPKPPA